jgi:rubredoxin
MKVYRCKRCNYIYDDGEQKKPFKDVGNEWKCPKCRSSKIVFVEKEINK